MGLTPGPGLDALIDSVVMDRPASSGTPPPYSTVTPEARSVLESLLPPAWHYDLSKTDPGWRCNIFRSGIRRSDEAGGDADIKILSIGGQTQAHAMCLAALDLKLARWSGRPAKPKTLGNG